MTKAFTIISICLIIIGSALPTLAVEVAPRITDREIIERLTRLEEGQKAIIQRLDNLESKLETGLESLRKEMLTGQEALRKEMLTGQEALRKEMLAGQEALRSDLRGLMLWGFGILFTGMFALIGFVLWDRHTAIRPVKLDLDELERNKVNKLIGVLRKLSADDPKVSEALRTFGLL